MIYPEADAVNDCGICGPFVRHARQLRSRVDRAARSVDHVGLRSRLTTCLGWLSLVSDPPSPLLAGKDEGNSNQEEEMMRSAQVWIVGALVMLALLTASGVGRAEDFKVGTTLENLMVAFNGESNASARYAKFAQQAET
jgi:hypothetical protein